MLLSKNLYLPSKRVKRLLLGASATNYKEDLKKLNITPYFLLENKAFGKLSGHLDLSVMPFGNNVFSSFQNFKIVNKYFKAIEINVSLFNEYPYNCAFNGLALNRYLICNKKCIALEILKYIEEKNFEVINVKQGYTKCSILPVNKNAVITDDKGIFKALKQKNIDVLLIQKGDIYLNGFDYGFIGGSAGLISNNEMLFMGNAKYHRNYFEIKDFLNNYNIDIISLNNNKITDIGSFLPIEESDDEKIK
ncbi:MAG: DUF6873 family GME fold protein [Candidatus Fimenecus sp.]